MLLSLAPIALLILYAFCRPDAADAAAALRLIPGDRAALLAHAAASAACGGLQHDL